MRNLTLLIVFVFIFSACNNKKESGGGWSNGPVEVVTQTVGLQKAFYYDQYPGTVTALNQVDLRAQVSGYITAVYFQDGQHVSKGQKLYSVDAQMYAANYEQAQANLQVQETNLLKAQKDADRYHELEKNDAIAKQQVDYADAARDAAVKQVAAAKANVQSMQTSVRYTTIMAPFDGTIGISQVKVGTAVSAGVTVLNTVSTDDPMAVDFAIGQDEIYRFTKLQQEAKGKSDSTFTIAFGENDVYPFAGHISLLDRAVDAQTGTLKVRLDMPNKNNLLRSGMSCTVRVLNQNPAPVVVIPHKAVMEQLGEFFVYVANGDKVTQRKVISGTAIGNQVIIKEGLQENEKIVVEGVQKLHEGSAIKEATDTTAAGKK